MKKQLISVLTVVIMAFSLFAITPDTASASSSYWIKINVQANVVNVYKKTDGQWVPYKAMLCSCGKSKTKTPIGNYSIKKKWRWKKLKGASAQWISQFRGNYLIHSVVYSKNKSSSSCIRSEYNKLGKVASHGCVRLATMDAKWIYQNCGKGTKVTTYKSSDPGPLGKPSKVPMLGTKKRGYDPTDDISKNKYFNMHGPVIDIDKASEIEYGQEFNIKDGVTAKSPYTFEDLTSSVQVGKIEFCEDDGSEYVAIESKDVDTTKAGTYKITYTCYNKYCGRNTVSAEFILVVNPETTDIDQDDQDTNAVEENADQVTDEEGNTDAEVGSESM